MFTNKPEFRVKEVIKLSKLSSDVLNDLLKESEVYLSKRILTYVLAQQISIQIASDRDLVHLRGYATELEDYTLLQLLNFTDAQGIEVDTFDIKFRLWTVVFNNLRELTIKDTTIKKALSDSEEKFEYAKDVFTKLSRFIDEANDLDGQPYIIAKESLTRFSSNEEVEALGISLGIDMPRNLDRESVVNFILRGLEDSSPDLKAELMKKSMDEIEEYARENFIADDLKMNKKEMVNYILDKYTPSEHHIRNIEYQKHLEIPSLYNYQVEDDMMEENLKPGQLFDDELKDMIATIVRGENHQLIEDITEDKSREELESVMNKIISTYEAPRRDSEEILLKKIDSLEQKLAERQSYDPNMIALMNKISNMETLYMQPQAPVNKEDLLLKKIEDIENKISMLARGENPELTEAQKIEQTLLSKIAELEEKLSYQRTVKTEEEPVQQVVEPIEEQVQIQERIEQPKFTVTASKDYEYDMDHFVPKPVVLLDEKQELPEEEVVEEPVVEEVPKGPSETELMLLKKIEEIELRMSEKDDKIDELIQEVEMRKQEALLKTVPVIEDTLVEDSVPEQKDDVLETQEEVLEPQEEIIESQDESVEDSQEDTEETLNELLDDSEEETDSLTTDEQIENTFDDTEEESLDEIMTDIEEMEQDSELDTVENDLDTEEASGELSDFDKFIEEIHSTKDKDKVKVRRRHTVKFIQVFWKAAAIWVMLAAIGAIILMVYNNL